MLISPKVKIIVQQHCFTIWKGFRGSGDSGAIVVMNVNCNSTLCATHTHTQACHNTITGGKMTSDSLRETCQPIGEEHASKAAMLISGKSRYLSGLSGPESDIISRKTQKFCHSLSLISLIYQNFLDSFSILANSWFKYIIYISATANLVMIANNANAVLPIRS